MIGDTRTAPEWTTIAGIDDEAPLRSWLGAPLIAKGRILGVLNISASSPDRFQVGMPPSKADTPQVEIILAVVTARLGTGQQAHRAGGLDRGLLDRLRHSQESREPLVILAQIPVGRVQPVDQLVLAAAGPLQELGHSGDRGADPEVPLHDRFGSGPVHGQQGHNLGEEEAVPHRVLEVVQATVAMEVVLHEVAQLT